MTKLILAVPPEEVLVVDEALEELSHSDPHLVELVKLRYYAEMSLEKTADVLEVSTWHCRTLVGRRASLVAA